LLARARFRIGCGHFAFPPRLALKNVLLTHGLAAHLLVAYPLMADLRVLSGQFIVQAIALAASIAARCTCLLPAGFRLGSCAFGGVFTARSLLFRFIGALALGVPGLCGGFPAGLLGALELFSKLSARAVRFRACLDLKVRRQFRRTWT
jgi:hypothetical protein